MAEIVVTDEAVEKARRAYSDACKDGRHPNGADRFRALLEAAAPLLQVRGGGGLRDALERLAVKWEGVDTPGLSAPSNQDWAKGVDAGYDQAADDLRGTLADHPSASLQVDREALAQILVTFGADVRLDNAEPAVLLGRTMDAVLALLSPEETKAAQCPENPSGHNRVTALDGDDKPLGYVHCGYCGAIPPS